MGTIKNINLKTLCLNIINNAVAGNYVTSGHIGDVYDINSMDVDYPTLVVTPTNANMDEYNITYNILLYITSPLNDMLNVVDIQNDSMIRMNKLITSLNDLQDIIINEPYNITFFKQRFSDECAGCYVNLILKVCRYDNTDC